MASSLTKPKTVYWQDYFWYDKINKLIDGHLADCKFIVGPEDETAEILYGHKICFIIESPVFETIFSDNYVEAQGKSEIRLNDVTPQDFKNLSYMIYSKSPFILNGLMLSKTITLYRLCDKYMMTSISQTIINHMKNPTYLEKICIDELIIVFGFAHELTDKSLLQDTRQIIQKKCKSYSERTDSLTEEAFYDFVRTLSESSESYKNPADKELYIYATVNSYFVRNNLLEVLNYDKQADPNDESMENSKKFDVTTINRIKILNHNLLKLIKFEKMDVDVFQNGPGSSKIISCEQKYSILSNLIKNCCIHSDPQWRVDFRNGTFSTICRHLK